MVSVSVLLHLLCIKMIFSQVYVFEWPPFSVNRMYLCLLVVLVVFLSGFEVRDFDSNCASSWLLRIFYMYVSV